MLPQDATSFDTAQSAPALQGRDVHDDSVMLAAMQNDVDVLSPITSCLSVGSEYLNTPELLQLAESIVNREHLQYNQDT